MFFCKYKNNSLTRIKQFINKKNIMMNQIYAAEIFFFLHSLNWGGILIIIYDLLWCNNCNIINLKHLLWKQIYISFQLNPHFN